MNDECLAKAEAKFTRAVTVAEAGNDCTDSGQASDLEAIVDAFFDELVDELARSPTTTTTSTTTPSTLPPCGSAEWWQCNGICPGESVCAPDSGGGFCRCVSPSSPCVDTHPVCNGVCPAGEECGVLSNPNPYTASCGCVPAGTTPCGGSGFPTCGGTCTPGLECHPFARPAGTSCACAPPGPCVDEEGGYCGIGIECPGDLICAKGPHVCGCFPPPQR
jgi:hypothetical protein